MIQSTSRRAFKTTLRPSSDPVTRIASPESGLIPVALRTEKSALFIGSRSLSLFRLHFPLQTNPEGRTDNQKAAKQAGHRWYDSPNCIVDDE